MSTFSRDRNAGTVVWSGLNPLERALVSIWSMKLQFERYYSDIREIVARSQARGYAAIAVHANHGVIAASSIPAAPPGTPSGVVVVGRHDHAPMQLAEDPTVALRHLAIRVLQGPSRPEVRIIDLNTGQGFEIEGAGHFEAAQIAGPAFVKIGAYAIMLFPRGNLAEIWPAAPHGMFDSLVQSRIVEKEARDIQNDIVSFTRGDVGGSGRRETVITRLQSPIVPRRAHRPDVLPPNTFAMLALDQHRDETVFPVTVEHLERGVLLGRYDRCEVELEGLWANDTASRVHLLLLKENETVLAIDTASSNGTFVNGRCVAMATMPDQAVIELAQGNIVRWSTVPSSGDGCAPDPGFQPGTKPEQKAARDATPDAGQKLALAPLMQPNRERVYIWPPRPTSRVRSAVATLKKHRVGAAWCLVIGFIVLSMIVDAVIPRGHRTETQAPRRCIDPIEDFGTDSPALRLYWYDQDPGVCFKCKWTPKQEDELWERESEGGDQ